MNSLFNQDEVVYSCDSSSLIMASGVLYPMDNFPALWGKIEELIRSERLKMSEPVYDEAMRGEVLRNWCREKELKPFLLSKVDESIQTTSLGDLSCHLRSAEHRNRVFSNVETRNCRESAQFTYNLAYANQKLGFFRYRWQHAFRIECIGMAGLAAKENWVF